jgi:hypothetical protein
MKTERSPRRTRRPPRGGARDWGDAWGLVGLAWRSPELREFTDRLLEDPALLRHANECWPVPSLSGQPTPA